MHFIHCAKIAFVFIASTIAVAATSTLEDSQLENLDKRATTPPNPLIQSNIQSFTCASSTSKTRTLTFSALSARVPLRNACKSIDNPQNGFPTSHVPTNLNNYLIKQGPFLKSPLLKGKLDTFIIFTRDCKLAAFESRNTIFTPVNVPTRLSSSRIGLLVRTISRDQSVKKRRDAQLEKKANVAPSNLQACSPKFF